MSPLQFQKQIRLQEARRLMLAENMDVTGVSSVSVTKTRLISAGNIKNYSVFLRFVTSPGSAKI
jgi:AraC-like DNA-binding protein